MNKGPEDQSYTDFGDPRWSRAKRIFEAASALPPDERDSYLKLVCGEDEDLRDQVRQMLDDLEEAGSFLEPPPEAPKDEQTFQPGTILVNRFRIQAFLGSGGMGQVYRAEDMLSGGTVALKSIRPEIAADTRSSNRLRRELRLSRQVTHPNVCRVYELWSTGEGSGEVVFLTMELLEGETLASRLARHGKLSPKTALAIARQMAAGIAEVHRIKIVHRDVKPSNVYLVPVAGGGDRAVVMDFGLARPALLTSGPELTQAGAVLGTPAYMAPELFQGNEATVSSDIYGFGVTLYEMLTGHNRLVVRPRKLVSGLDDAWERAILQCLDPDPAKRPKSTTSVIELIERGPRVTGLKFALIAVAVMIAAIAAVLLYASVQGPAAQPRIARITFTNGVVQDFAYSADGKTLVYASDQGTSEGNFSIWVADASGTESDARQLVKSRWHDWEPSISPDGRTVAFRSEREGSALYTVPVEGGAPKFLVAYGHHPRFSRDGKSIAYWTGQPGDTTEPSARAYVIPVSGGEPRPIAPKFADVRYPVWAPHTNQVLFWGAPTGLPSVARDTGWFVENLDTGQIVRTHASAKLTQLGLDPQWAPVFWSPNSIVFSARSVYSNNLWQLGFSEKSPDRVGDLKRITTGSGFEAIPWVLPNGDITYASWTGKVPLFRVPLAPGRHRPELISEDDARNTRPTVSRDDRFLLFARRVSDMQSIYLKDLTKGLETLVTRAMRGHPTISPDGARAAYTEQIGNATRIYLRPLPTGAETVVCEHCGPVLSWLPDCSALLYLENSLPAEDQIRMLNLSSGAVNTVLVGDRFNTAAVAPGFKRIAFTVRVDGSHSTIYTAPFARGSQTDLALRVPATSGTGWEEKPQWSADGREIFFSSNRDGFVCLWRQRLDLSGNPVGQPDAVLHLHKAILSPVHLSHTPAYNLAAGSDYLYFNAGSMVGNLWQLQR